MNKGSALYIWYHLLILYWKSSQKIYLACFLLFAVFFASIADVYSAVKINAWYSVFYDAIQRYDLPSFYASLKTGLFWMSVSVVAVTSSIFFAAILEIKWRKWLTGHFLNKWFNDNAFYHTQLVHDYQDNPDQRISEDIHTFVNLTIKIPLKFLISLMTLGSFIIILWNLSGSFIYSIYGYSFYIPGFIVWAALIYALIGTFITFKIGHPLISLKYNQQKYEANFRYSLVRIRENSLAIAAYDGADKENSLSRKEFADVVSNFINIAKLNLKIGLFSYGYGSISTILPSIIAAGHYFAKKITLGNLMQINSAFGRVQYAIAYFIYAYDDLAELRAVTKRLQEFDNAVLSVNKSFNTISKSKEDFLIVSNLEVFDTENKKLLCIPEIILQAKSSVLIMGGVGVGKSTILKTLNGMWHNYSGFFYKNPSIKSIFVSQQNYMPYTSLKEVICYPMSYNLPNDDVCQQILEKCLLHKYIDSLHITRDWSKTLSSGEQQQVIFCRLLINRPEMIFLDEVTSSLDINTGLYLYELLQIELPDSAILSISHNSELKSYHKQIIKM
ncbi:MAG: ABC transporter ATP-binding protein/permease [Burkholderiales bacterium]|nr:ABC transporter ATP-binding protein/permease [Burkholderiales bacterium]